MVGTFKQDHISKKHLCFAFIKALFLIGRSISWATFESAKNVSFSSFFTLITKDICTIYDPLL